MWKTTRADIDDFLAQRRLAMVGVSRNAKEFSRTLFHDLCARNYDMVPVNPFADEMEDKTCFCRVQDIDPPVEGALLMTSPAAMEQALHDCAAVGIRRIWMYRAGGSASISSEVIKFCEENRIRLVAGYCPYMFLPEAQFIHRLHGFFLKLTCGYPGRPASSTPQ